MELIILAILIGILLLGSGFLVKFAEKSYKNSWLLAGIMSFVLLPVTLLLLNQENLVLPQQNEAIEWVAKKWEMPAAKKKKYEWVKDNFIFIDISYSNHLISKPGSNQLGNSSIVISDRKELARLFELFKSAHSNIDFVICDLYFDFESSDDSLLRAVLTDQPLQSKILTAENNLRPNIGPFASLTDSVYGNIVEEANHNFFSTYNIYRDNRPGLAYLGFTKIKSLTANSWGDGLFVFEKERRSGFYGLNAYIPQFELTEENKLYGNQEDPSGKEISSTLNNHNYFEIGDLVAEHANADWFSDLLKQRKNSGGRNVILIGALKSEEKDVHSTYYGKMHGATIHLNLLYSLLNGQHRINVFYLLYLWIFMAFIIYLVIRKSLGRPIFMTNIRFKKSKKQAKATISLRSLVRAVWDLLIIDELHFWLFVLFVLATAILWGRIINGFVLVLLLQLIYKVFQYYKKSAEEK